MRRYGEGDDFKKEKLWMAKKNKRGKFVWGEEKRRSTRKGKRKAGEGNKEGKCVRREKTAERKGKRGQEKHRGDR